MFGIACFQRKKWPTRKGRRLGYSLRCRYILGTWLTVLLLVQPSVAQERVFTFGVVPQQSAKTTAALWAPLLRDVGNAVGVTLQFRTARSIPVFEQRLAAGEYDFAYMNPYHYTVFSQDALYMAIARRRDQKIRGIVVVRKDSRVERLEDLRGATLAFPSPAAFGASVLPMANFSEREIMISPRFVASHDSVYLSVAKGLFPAGGGVQRTLNNIAPEIREQLRILWTTKDYTPHAIAAHKRIAKPIRVAVTQALTALSGTESGKHLLANLKIKHGIEAAHDSDWDDVRAININVLQPGSN